MCRGGPSLQCFRASTMLGSNSVQSDTSCFGGGGGGTPGTPDFGGGGGQGMLIIILPGAHFVYVYAVPSVVHDVAFGEPRNPAAHFISTSNNRIPEGVKSGKPFELLL